MNYRLSSTDFATTAGGATFPQHLEDCMRAVAWARGAEGRMYGAGATVVVGGDSAGGHLACLGTLVHHYEICSLSVPVGLTLSVPRMVPAGIQMDGGLRVDGVIDLYGLHNPSLTKGFRSLFRFVVLKAKFRDHPQLWKVRSLLANMC